MRAPMEQLMQDMADGRYAKLVRLGFDKAHVEKLAPLHTRNFI